MRHSEIVVIGGGVAGLNAARLLAEQGLQVEILEASHRVGGRAHTLYDGHDLLPVELGPEFVHGAPGATHELIREAKLELEPIDDTHHLVRDGGLVDAGDLWARFGELLAGAPDPSHDESAHGYMSRMHMAPDDVQLFALFAEGFYGAPIDDVSIASIAADASGLGGDEAQQQRVRGGYGRVVAWLAERAARAGVVMHHGCVVQAIHWQASPVAIEFLLGTELAGITADRAIVTLPVGVLHEPGAVRFTPELHAHRAALAQLAMGQVVKLVACLREPVWMPGAPTELRMVHGGDRGFPTYWLRTRGTVQQLTAWAGGRHARALAECSPGELAERALDGFARAVSIDRARVHAAMRDFHSHDFAADPCARGAYSYTRVGGVGAAEALARPLEDRLFFAGEATDARYEGTVAGALASGTRVAGEVIAVTTPHARARARAR
ncbi:MAG TPA: NAD(P)/FAD-dependent oxidoreductase [Kofleriaceae bacterium]|jgi:monoamine oxidase